MWEALLGLLGRGAATAEGAVIGEAAGGAAKTASKDVPELLKHMASATAQNYAKSPIKDRTQSPAEKTMDRISAMMRPENSEIADANNDTESHFEGKSPVFDRPIHNPIVDRVMNLEGAKNQAGPAANDLVRNELIVHLEPVLKDISNNTFKTTEYLQEIDFKINKILADGGVKRFEENQDNKSSDNDNTESDDKPNKPNVLNQDDKPNIVSAVKKLAIGGGMALTGKLMNWATGGDQSTDNTHSGGYGQDKPVDLGKGLGALSEKYESGGSGVSTISSGQNDPKGGVSYGKYQLASRTGSMSAFINSKEGQPFQKDFQGLTPGTDSFNAKYREVVKSHGNSFDKAQHDFLGRTHYNVALQEAKKNGFDTGDRAIQEAIWAMAMHLGPAGAKKAIDSASSNGVSKNKTSQLNALYEARTSYWQSHGAAGGQAVASRLVRERRDALNIENGNNIQMAGNQGKDNKRGSAGLSGHENQGNPGQAQTLANNNLSASRINPSNIASGNRSGLGQQLTQNSAKETAKSSQAPHVTVHTPQQTASTSQSPKAPPRGIPSARPEDQSIWEKYFSWA